MISKPVNCKYCGKELEWRKKKDGKYYLAEKDGEPHMRNCAKSPYSQGRMQ